MPAVFYTLGFRFFFYSNEGIEPMHIHVEKGGAEGKYWIDSIIEVAYLHGFTITEQKLIDKLIFDHKN